MSAATGRRYRLSMNDMLVAFHAASVLRGPTWSELAAHLGMSARTSTKRIYDRLIEVGWVARNGKDYVLTPAGERHFRTVVPRAQRRGPTWPID